MASKCAAPLLSAAEWIRGVLWTPGLEEAGAGRGSWGRDSELEEEPTLLQDSEPEGKGRRPSVSCSLTFTEEPPGV